MRYASLLRTRQKNIAKCSTNAQQTQNCHTQKEITSNEISILAQFATFANKLVHSTLWCPETPYPIYRVDNFYDISNHTRTTEEANKVIYWDRLFSPQPENWNLWCRTIMGTTFIRAHTPYVSFFCSAIGARSPNAPQLGKQRERAKLWLVHTASGAIRTQKGKFDSEAHNRMPIAQVLDGRNFLRLYTNCGIPSKSILTNLPHFYLFPSSISISSDVRSNVNHIHRRHMEHVANRLCFWRMCAYAFTSPLCLRFNRFVWFVWRRTFALVLFRFHWMKQNTHAKAPSHRAREYINEFLSIAQHLCKLILMMRIAPTSDNLHTCNAQLVNSCRLIRTKKIDSVWDKFLCRRSLPLLDSAATTLISASIRFPSGLIRLSLHILQIVYPIVMMIIMWSHVCGGCDSAISNFYFHFHYCNFAFFFLLLHIPS